MDYIESFRNLKPVKKYARRSPEKAVLLLAVIELYEEGKISDNRIEYDDALATSYRQLWNKLLPDEATLLPDTNTAFWAMHTEPFWHIVPVRGKEESIEILRSLPSTPSDSAIQSNVKYVELDEDLYFLLTISSGRRSLKEALLETYFDLSDKRLKTLLHVREKERPADIDFDAMMSSVMDKSDAARSVTGLSAEETAAAVDEEVWLSICVSYYTFLKKHALVRQMFTELFTSPTAVCKFVLRQEEVDIPASLCNDVITFLRDLQFALMKDNNSVQLVDAISGRINELESAGTGAQEYVPETPAIEESPTIVGEEDVQEVETPDEGEAPFDYKPKGKLIKIEERVDSSYDYLWTMAIIDLVRQTNREAHYTFDNIACMMIANAWDLLRDDSNAMEREPDLRDCINFLIDESKEEMQEPLTWQSDKEEVFNAIKDFPMYDVFENTVDELLSTSPMNVLKTWYSDLSDMEAAIESLNFTRPCLYALHLRKVDPYIEVNRKWLNNLYYEHDDLIKYFSIRYYEHINK